MTVKLIPPAAEYARVFDEERVRSYPQIDAIEDRAGYALERSKLEEAARVLACPVKAHAPNWQHGRVVYALTRQRLAASIHEPIALLDIGTAKGFSALCLEWALLDSGAWYGGVYSTDVIDPESHARRNTVAEVDGLKTLREILEPWPETQRITFWHLTGVQALESEYVRDHGYTFAVAFVDGKHDRDVVQREGDLLAERQRPGDLAIFDDCQIDGVRKAVNSLGSLYAFEPVEVNPDRAYAIGVRR